ncbi:hypothetical protein [Scytonema sp. NUACC26]|uniref:hypothetical protein n=1 Tax=Scytonema sp. NUACC26 TaxID=3140176 RepID=UPI0034DB8391
MRALQEIQVFSAVIKDYCLEEFLIETSAQVCIPYFSLAWENMTFHKISACGSFFDGTYTLQKDTYNDWILINTQSDLLTPFITNHQVTLISLEKADLMFNNPDNRWYVFHTLTRPGFAPDFSQALIQITAYCPAGPPQYGSLLYLERNNEQWQVKSSYGLYNQ